MSKYKPQRKIDSNGTLEDIIISSDNIEKDTTVTQNSTKPITSGAVYTALSSYLQGSKYNANNPSTFIGYSSSEQKNSLYQVVFKEDNDTKGICWNKFANVYDKTGITPSQAVYNGFYYVSSSTASLSGADSNPFLAAGLHPSNADFRILTTGYNGNDAATWLQQIATDFRSNYIFFRRKENGTWYDWVQIAPKQDTLVSGTNIKTINNNSILGSGNISISADTSNCIKNNQAGTIIASNTDTPLYLQGNSGATYIGFKNSSGTVLGYFAVNSSKKPVFYDTADHQLAYTSDVSGKQDALVSGTNIKTINGSSVLGSGDLIVSGTPQLSGYTFTLKTSITSTKTATSSMGLSSGKTYLLVPYSLTSSIAGIRMATGGSTSLNNASSAPIFCYCKNDTDYGRTLWWNLQGSTTNTMITYLAYCRVYEVATA